MNQFSPLIFHTQQLAFVESKDCLFVQVLIVEWWVQPVDQPVGIFKEGFSSVGLYIIVARRVHGWPSILATRGGDKSSRRGVEI